MKTVNMHEAKTRLSRLIAAAAEGESLVIVRAGKPLVKVAPVDPPARPSRLGGMLSEAKIPDDFDTMFAEEIREMFEVGDGGPDWDGAPMPPQPGARDLEARFSTLASRSGR